jgi:hypothetical protein
MFQPPSDSPERKVRQQDIKQWGRELLGAEDDDVVMVTELRCSEPGCPPLETIIALLGAHQRRQVKVHKPLLEVTREDIELAINATKMHLMRSLRSAAC